MGIKIERFWPSFTEFKCLSYLYSRSKILVLLIILRSIYNCCVYTAIQIIYDFFLPKYLEIVFTMEVDDIDVSSCKLLIVCAALGIRRHRIRPRAPRGFVGICGEWLFIFRELGSTGNCFQGFGE